MKTYLFPGQGSQHIGMGKELFEQFPELVQSADDILEYSIKSLCLFDKDKQLHSTQYTQPALYVVEALAYLQHQALDETAADFLVGHSLGEYSALFASGAVTFEKGLQLVKKRGELMSQAAEGAMAAALDIDEHTLRDCLAANQLQAIDIANLNSSKQIVISGLVEDIVQSQAIIEKAGGRFVRLNTSGAFHSRYMAPAQELFASYINDFEFSGLQIPVIANVDAAPYQVANIKENLIAQLAQPVQWSRSIDYLLAQGEMQFKELGPKKVLTKLVEYIQKDFAARPSQDENLATQQTTREEKAFTESANVVSANTQQSIDQAKQKIDYWNRHYPIGTAVRWAHDADLLNTRSKATLLFGHRAAIYLQGYNGYFALNEVTPA